MTFQETTDRLMALGVSLPEIAAALDRGVQSIRQARLEPENDGHRSPPPGWRGPLAELARSRAGHLSALAQDIDPG